MSGIVDSTKTSEAATENVRERYPYGYSGELSEECEIPLAVLKKFYDEYDSEDDDDEWESRHVAMVVEEPIEKDDEEGFSSSATSTTERGCGAPIKVMG